MRCMITIHRDARNLALPAIDREVFNALQKMAQPRSSRVFGTKEFSSRHQTHGAPLIFHQIIGKSLFF